MNTSEHYRILILDCQNRAEQLTEWEENFLISISEQLDNKKTLSHKQVNILENLWEKVTENG